MTLALALMPASALAQGPAASDADGAAMGWTLAAALLVLLAALPGLMLFQAGAARTRSILSVAVHGVAAVALASLAWAMAGYSLAFAPGSWWIGGAANLGLANLAGQRTGLRLSEPVFALFQTVLALLPPALLVGALAERVRLGWLILFVPLWTLIVYAPVARWLWSSWLADLGTRDFASGLAVHALAGVSALVLALLVGPREAMDARDRPTHSPLLRLLGAGLLWVGLLGLAGGSALGAGDDAAYAILNSHLAACAGALGWLGLATLMGERPGARALASGAVAGLAASASAAGFVGPVGAVAIGFLAVIACFFTARLVTARGIDDAGQVFAIHGVGGMAGALLLVPFAATILGGAGYAGGATLLTQSVAQIVGVATILLWAGLWTLLLALLVSIAVPMRVPAEIEAAGLDDAVHGERAWTHD